MRLLAACSLGGAGHVQPLLPLLLRDLCEFSSAVIAHRRAIPAVQVAISMADVEIGSIAVAAPALEMHQPGLTDAVRATPYLTRFPASTDPSSFASPRARDRSRDLGASVGRRCARRRHPLLMILGLQSG
jgi:hypothetical protein